MTAVRGCSTPFNHNPSHIFLLPFLPSPRHPQAIVSLPLFHFLYLIPFQVHLHLQLSPTLTLVFLFLPFPPNFRPSSFYTHFCFFIFMLFLLVLTPYPLYPISCMHVILHRLVPLLCLSILPLFHISVHVHTFRSFIYIFFFHLIQFLPLPLPPS